MVGAYRGRIAPTPTGYLHVGHARTFWAAYQRARVNGGCLVYRNEDLDPERCRTEYVQASIEDLKWLGIDWKEGPDQGGAFAPYHQSERMSLYQSAINQLIDCGWVYRCWCTRKDLLNSLHAPHPGEGDDEPIYPGTCRRLAESSNPAPDKPYAWRFKVPEGGKLLFDDGCRGLQQFKGGVHFGDFVVWQKDGRPSYQLAVVVDDAAMRITEVVRGEDLLKSAARQLLIYKALDLPVPSFFHCPLVKDDHGVRLAKRHDALSLRSLKQKLGSPTSLIDSWQRFW
jgi:glutamyl-tRNA synthetase